MIYVCKGNTTLMKVIPSRKSHIIHFFAKSNRFLLRKAVLQIQLFMLYSANGLATFINILAGRKVRDGITIERLSIFHRILEHYLSLKILS